MKYRLPAATAAVIAAASLGVSATMATPVFAATTTSSTPTELIVGLRSASEAPSAVSELDADPDVRVLSSDVSTGLKAVTVAVPEGQEADAVAALKANPDVTYVEPNAVAEADLVTPNDPMYGRQWGMSTAKVSPAWNVTTGGTSTVVAVVDTGVDSINELAGRVRTGYDFVNNDADPADDEGHGTMAASVIAATGNNGTGLAGVCWGCQILPVKVLDANGEGTYDDIAKGITYAADQGADVINLSLGGSDASQLLTAAVDYAHSKGAVVIASAGNDGTTDPTYPAAITNAIAVAGSTQTDGRYSWSNYNSSASPWVDLAAPGSNVAQSSDGSYYMFEGTSSAAPVVAGVAALALAANPKATADEVRTALEDTADNVGTWVSHGRLNAEDAIAEIATGGQSNAALTISDIAVTPASPVKGGLTVTPTVTSTAGTVKTVKMTVTLPTGKTATVAAAAAPWTMKYSNITTGSVTVVVTATDTAGNTATASTIVTVDNTVPSAALTLPAFTTGPTAVALASPADDTAKMDVYIKNIKVGTVTADPWSYDWDTTGLSGSVAVKVIVTDVAGNTATSAKNVVVDNAGPKLTWGGPSVALKSALRGTVDVKATASDTSGVASVEVLDGDGNVLGTDTATPFVIPVDGSLFSGNTTLTLRATDKLGQITTLDKTLLFDNTAPVVGDVTANASRGALTLTPDITEDTGLKSLKMVLTLPTGKVVTVTGATTAPYAAKWTSTGVTGTVSAAVTATDWAGNITTGTSTFEVDNAVPSGVWTMPTYVNGTVAVGLTTPSDDTASMSLLVKGVSVAQITSAPWSIDWDTTGLTGAVSVGVRTTDTAGNVVTVSKTVTVDHTGPKVGVSTLNFVASASTAIKLSVADPAGVDSVELLDADGQSLATSSTSPYTLTLDTTGMTKGAATWTVKATDKLGNVSTTAKVFTIA